MSQMLAQYVTLHDARMCYTDTYQQKQQNQQSRSTPVIIQNRDGSIAEEHPSDRSNNGYYAAIPANLLDDTSSLIERIINFAFDTLGAQHVDMRVYDVDDE